MFGLPGSFSEAASNVSANLRNPVGFARNLLSSAVSLAMHPAGLMALTGLTLVGAAKAADYAGVPGAQALYEAGVEAGKKCTEAAFIAVTGAAPASMDKAVFDALPPGQQSAIHAQTITCMNDYMSQAVPEHGFGGPVGCPHTPEGQCIVPGEVA